MTSKKKIKRVQGKRVRKTLNSFTGDSLFNISGRKLNGINYGAGLGKNKMKNQYKNEESYLPECDRCLNIAVASDSMGNHLCRDCIKKDKDDEMLDKMDSHYIDGEIFKNNEVDEIVKIMDFLNSINKLNFDFLVAQCDLLKTGIRNMEKIRTIYNKAIERGIYE